MTDRGFFIGDMICVALFALEMLLLAWTRTSFTSFVPPRFDGYLLSPLFFLDAIVIVSLLVPVLLNTPIDVGTDTRVRIPTCIVCSSFILRHHRHLGSN
jgi:hypothetical protein